MKRLMVFGIVALVCLYLASPVLAAEQGSAPAAMGADVAAPKAASAANEVVVADFDTGDKPNNLGGDFGSWDKDPNDETQSCQMSFDSDDAKGVKTGYSVRLDYDVDSPNPAYNGFWMKFNNLDATQYNTLNFYMKGDAAKGYTKRVKIELKDANGSSPYILSGITDQWQKFSIPFEKFRKIKDWSKLSEIVVVFDDINSSPKTGAIFLDNVTLSSQ